MYNHIDEIIKTIEKRSMDLFNEISHSFVLGYFASHIQADLDDIGLTEEQTKKLEYSLARMKRFVENS